MLLVFIELSGDDLAMPQPHFHATQESLTALLVGVSSTPSDGQIHLLHSASSHHLMIGSIRAQREQRPQGKVVEAGVLPASRCFSVERWNPEVWAKRDCGSFKLLSKRCLFHLEGNFHSLKGSLMARSLSSRISCLSHEEIRRFRGRLD